MKSKVLNITKGTVISFFVIVFILGFFSKSIVNLFLPKVQTITPVKGSFYETLNVEGEIEPKETFKVRLNGNVMIEEYFVQIGDEVEKGDPIFKINSDYGINRVDKSIEDLKLSVEKQRVRLEKLQENSYEMDEKKIKLLEERINMQKNQISKKEKLYKAGSITATELENSKQSLKEAEMNFEMQKISVEEKKKLDSIAIKEVVSNIKELQREINDIEKRQNFYSDIADDGIYYSEIDGIFLKNSRMDGVVYRDTAIVEIGKVKNFDSVKFVTQIPQKHYDFVNNNRIIEIKNSQGNKSSLVRITNISKVVTNNMIEIEGEFSDEMVDEEPIIGQKFRGEIKKKFVSEKVLPKSAIIPSGEFKAGNKGYVYVMVEEKGALGIEYIAKMVSITMTDVGDYYAGISMEGYDKVKVITSLSYKINDGAKVLPWE